MEKEIAILILLAGILVSVLVGSHFFESGGVSWSQFKNGDIIWSVLYGTLECVSSEEVTVTLQAKPGSKIYCPPIYSEIKSMKVGGDEIFDEDYVKARSVKSCKVFLKFDVDGFGKNKVVLIKHSPEGDIKYVISDDTGLMYKTYQDLTDLKGNLFSETLKSKEWIEVVEAYDCTIGTIGCYEIPLEFKLRYTPYKLHVEEEGKDKYYPVEEGCVLKSDSAVLKEDIKKVKKVGDFYVLPLQQPINYPTTWVPTYTKYKEFGLYDYKGMKVLCTTKYAYPVEKFELADGTWGWKKSGRGFPVECCPHPTNPYCKIENGEFVRVWSPPKENEKCSAWSISSYDWIPIEGGKVAKFECRNGRWVKIDEKEFECLKDGGCGVNEICEDFECKKLGDYKDFYISGKGKPVDLVGKGIDIFDFLTNLAIGGLVILGIILIIAFVSILLILLLVRR